MTFDPDCQQNGRQPPRNAHPRNPRAESGTLAEQVFARLSAAILAGELAPGAKISEPALAKQYGVSRGPLREALHRLQERRLITPPANTVPRIVKASSEA